MKTTAAILTELARPLESALELVELELPALKPGQVLVEIKYSGVCHTQLMEVSGLRGKDPFLPHCLGHEGSGEIVEISAGVSHVKVGDTVILSWLKGAGANVPGCVYLWNGQKVNAGGITTFSKFAILSENRVSKLADGVSLKDAALIGCAVSTGVGSVFNTAAARAGQNAVVFGTGGIGLCAVIGARIAKCDKIIAVDVNQKKLELARTLGATHVIDANQGDPVKLIKEICANGADFAVEATGNVEVMKKALSAVRSQGGFAVVIGNAPAGNMLSIDPSEFNQGKQLRGTWGGDTSPERDFPRYCDLIRSGELNINHLRGEAYSLNNINQAMSDLKNGRAVRPLIDMSLN
jgi:S-(hydroxymethyl)glutathione dehydrogenase/alcohol dehydrogenase